MPLQYKDDCRNSSHILSLFLAKNKQNKKNCNVSYTVKRPVIFIEKEKKREKSVNTY